MILLLPEGRDFKRILLYWFFKIFMYFRLEKKGNSSDFVHTLVIALLWTRLTHLVTTLAIKSSSTADLIMGKVAPNCRQVSLASWCSTSWTYSLTHRSVPATRDQPNSQSPGTSQKNKPIILTELTVLSLMKQQKSTGMPYFIIIFLLENFFIQSTYSAVRLKWTLWDQRKVFTLSKVHFNHHGQNRQKC